MQSFLNNFLNPLKSQFTKAPVEAFSVLPFLMSKKKENKQELFISK